MTAGVSAFVDEAGRTSHSAVGPADPLSRLRRQLSFQGSLMPVARFAEAAPTNVFRASPGKPEKLGTRIYGSQFRVLSGGSQWQSALPTGSRWQSAQPTPSVAFGDSSPFQGSLYDVLMPPLKGEVPATRAEGFAEAMPTNVFRASPGKPEKLGTRIYGPQFRVLSGGSQWQSALPTGGSKRGRLSLPTVIALPAGAGGSLLSSFAARTTARCRECVRRCARRRHG